MISINDITTWNWEKGSHKTFNFSISKITEDIMSDEEAVKLETFIYEKKIFADMFNIEYMGYLIGQVDCSKEELVTAINDFFNDNTDAKN